MKYHVNLIKEMLKEEKLEKARSLRVVVYSWIAFGVLALALLDSSLRILNIRQHIAFEQEKLDRIEEEYQTYQATSVSVNQMDIELLDQLQHNRIFWTKKLAATALYLPTDYWIENLKFNNIYEVSGFGYTVPQQKQLITMDNYLNKLRNDSTFNDDFPFTFLDAVVRTDEKNVKRVLFELSADKKVGN